MSKPTPPIPNAIGPLSLFCLLGLGSFGWISTSALTGELKLAGLGLLILGGGILLQRSIKRRPHRGSGQQ